MLAPIDEDSKLLTVQEVAYILRVSKMTVYRLIEMRKLRAIKILHTFRIREDHLAEYINESWTK